MSHIGKREYSTVKEKREDGPRKIVKCINCGRVIAKGSDDLIVSGKLSIDCPKCGTTMTIEVEPNDKTRGNQSKY